MIVAAFAFLLGDLFVFANGQLLSLTSMLCVAVAVLTISAWQRSWTGVWFVAAALWAWQTTEQRLDERFDAARDGEIIEVEGTIASLVQRDRFRQRFEFAPADESRAIHDLPPLIRVSDYYPAADKHQGEHWRLLLKIRSPRGFVNTGSFDLERYYFQRRIGATAYVRDSTMNQRTQAADGLASLRDRVHAKLSNVLDDNPYRGWIIALAMGERGELQDADWELLRATGTTHLFAISGLHLGLIALLFGGLLSLPARVLPAGMRKPFIGIFVIVACAAYAWLAGGALPVQRALIMVTIGTLYVLHARKLQALQAVSAALLLVLAIDPLAVLSEGFWFSFSAVMLIAFLAAGSVVSRGAINTFLRIQLGLTLLMAPLVMMAFGMFPLANIPANLVAIPLVGMLLLPLVMLLLLASSFGLPQESLQWAVTQGFGAMLDYLAWLSDYLPNAIIGIVPPTSLVLLMFGLLAWWLPPTLRMRRWSIFLVLPFVSFFLPAGWSGNAMPEVPYGEWQATFLDTGQGLSVVVRTESNALVYDTGPIFGDTAAANMVLIPFLEAKRWQPDRLVVSHGDRDHAGGLAAVQERYPGLPGAFECARGERWVRDGVQFEFLHPQVSSRPVQLADIGNNDSCVLQVTNGRHRLLLTGDIEWPAERQLLKAGISTFDVVLVPHHGSRTSSTADFVQAVSPEFAIVAAGHGNQWGFPKADVVKRWQAVGATVHVTGEQGMIVVNSSPGGIHVEAMRDTQARIWRQAAQQTR